MKVFSFSYLKLIIALLLWIAGVAAFVVGVGIWRSQRTLAQATKTTYTSTWSVNKWANCTVEGITTLSVGPHQWKVTGTVGTTAFKENWTAASYKKSNVSCLSGSSPNVGTTYTPTVSSYENTGLYGMGRYVRNCGSCGAVIGDAHAVFPDQWSVKGCVGSGCTDTDVGL